MRLALLSLALAGCAAAGPIKSVTVRDSQFNLVKVLADEELATFERLWEHKAEVTVPLKESAGAQYKLDIERQNAGGRWLYQSSGFTQFLSVLEKPVYKVADPEAFNELIGAAK